MTRTIRLLAVTGLAAIGLTAWADDDTKPFDDNTFVTMAASDNMAEIDLGKLAGERSKNEEVKKYGKRLVDDHQKAQEELKTAAKSAGVTIPEKMNEEHQKACDKFKDYRGENFDRDFVKHMVMDHEKAVKLFTRATKEAKSQQLKDFAMKTLPVLQSHLDEAKKLQDQIK